MTPGDTLTHSHCIIDLFSSLGFPDLETGSCRWGSSNCGGFFSSSWGSANCGIFFPPLGFPDLETGSCRGGLFSSAFRIWKQGRAGGGLLPRLSGFGNRVHAGGVAVIRRGGVDPLNFVIDIAPSPLCHRSFWFPRLSGFGNRVRYLLYAGGVDLVNFVICNFRFSTTDYRIWKQCCELDFMICRRACMVPMPLKRSFRQ